LRNENEDLKLVLHGHRAGHAALTRNKKHGISMVPLADAARLIGVDQLHIGTGVGKMEGSAKEVADLTHEIEDLIVKPHGHILAENWGNVKPVFAVCSGGLYPGTIPKLVDLFGKDIIIQAGGGVHGNPMGTAAGAKSIRQAIDAVMKGIDLKTYAEKHKELKIAIEKWGLINV
jgi:ribulose-bisphosphate carboxylase large chain